MNDHTPHWSDYLVQGIPHDQDSTISITLNPQQTRPSIIMLATRLHGLVDALAPRNHPDGTDPLTEDHPDDVRRLIDHLHRVIAVLQGEEERLTELAHHQGTSLRALADALDLAGPESVRYRLAAIDRAHQRGHTAAAETNNPHLTDQ